MERKELTPGMERLELSFTACWSRASRGGFLLRLEMRFMDRATLVRLAPAGAAARLAEIEQERQAILRHFPNPGVSTPEHRIRRWNRQETQKA